MPYQIAYEDEQDYLSITVEGDFALSTLKQLAEDVAEFIKKYGCHRILNDMRRAKLTRGTVDIYNMPQVARQAGVTEQCKRALVVSELSSDFYFLETVFLNQGNFVKLFTDMEEAMQWLLAN